MVYPENQLEVSSDINSQNELLIVAVRPAISKSVEYIPDLGIKPREYPRYFKKSILLAMLYSGFAQNLSRKQAERAGLAGFLSCAYDVVTDWRNDKNYRETFINIGYNEAPPQLAEMAIDMLERDISGDQNCLNSERRDMYLQKLIDELDDETIEDLFPHGRFLKYIIRHERKRAESMLL